MCVRECFKFKTYFLVHGWHLYEYIYTFSLLTVFSLPGETTGQIHMFKKKKLKKLESVPTRVCNLFCFFQEIINQSNVLKMSCFCNVNGSNTYIFFPEMLFFGNVRILPDDSDMPVSGPLQQHTTNVPIVDSQLP